MRYWKIIVPELPASAMALYPFMLFKSPSLKHDPVIINHEEIHFRQQLELLILPFYLIYLGHYLINRLRYKNHDQAYLAICFEKEAYTHDRDLNYLKKRRFYQWAIKR